jgi:hypothetical protein
MAVRDLPETAFTPALTLSVNRRAAGACLRSGNHGSFGRMN